MSWDQVTRQITGGAGMARPSSLWQAVLRSSIQSKRLASVSRLAGHLYYGLLLVSDQKGRFYGEAELVSGHVFPRKVGQPDTAPAVIEGELQELERAGLVERFEFDGDLFLALNDYYSPSNKGRDKSIFPAPEEGTPWVGEVKNATEVPETPVPAEWGLSGDQVGTGRGPSGDPIPETLDPRPKTLDQCSGAEHGVELSTSYQHSEEKPKRKRKPPVNGLEELAGAINLLENSGALKPLDVEFANAAEGYRKARTSRRFPVYRTKDWTDNFEAAVFDGSFSRQSMIDALKTATRAKWQSLHPKAPQAPNKPMQGEMRGVKKILEQLAQEEQSQPHLNQKGNPNGF